MNYGDQQSRNTPTTQKNVITATQSSISQQSGPSGALPQVIIKREFVSSEEWNKQWGRTIHLFSNTHLYCQQTQQVVHGIR